MKRIKKPVISKAQVLETLAANPGATKRDLVRLMGVKGSDRIDLKHVLKELEEDGVVKGTRKRGYAKPGALPDVLVVETYRDADGDLFARPFPWEGEEAPPVITVVAEAPLGVGEKLLVRLSKNGDGFTARIIRRLVAAQSRILAVLRKGEGGMRLIPVDKKARHDYFVTPGDLNGAVAGELVLAEPMRRGTPPKARVIERLGNMEAPKAISLIAIHTHGIPDEFPADVVAAAKAAQPVSKPDDRTDLRKIPLVTIDPEDARDFDDAVWAEPVEGGFDAIVAIADVAHYVRPGTPLDKEAYKRGNSVYFPDRVVPMLPEELSNDLCSLRPDEDRACMAVRMHFDASGKLKSHKFMRGLMRSAARLTYAEAQKAFDGQPVDIPEAARGTLKGLWSCYNAMVKARAHRSPLDLDLPERRIRIDEAGKVTGIGYKERLESMRLIEELMVMANVAAAETLEKKQTPQIYRVHDVPSLEKLQAFSDYLRTIGMNFAKGQVIKPAAFNQILTKVKGGPHEAVLNDVVLRSQAQAVYAPVNVGHFGLNLAKYAHFTSPIRRYADLIVHRALIRAHGFGVDGLSESESKHLAVIAEHISLTERRAMMAERDSADRYVAAYMADRVGAEFEARVVSVTRFGLFLRLAESGADGLLPARMLGTEYFRYEEKKQALIGEHSGTSYSLGDIVSVRLAEADALTGGLRFDLAGAATPSRTKSRTGAERGRRVPRAQKAFSRKKRT